MLSQLLAAGAAGIVLGVLAVIVGMADLRHRDRVAGHDQAIAQHPAMGQITRPVRGRWS